MRRTGPERITRHGARAVAVAAALGACGFLQKTPQDTPAQIAARAGEDARIQGEVEARLAAEPSIGAGRVRADVRCLAPRVFSGTRSAER
ncbi:MAG TPA: hypothetical protein VF541_15365 [Longimicrobium sp.]